MRSEALGARSVGRYCIVSILFSISHLGLYAQSVEEALGGFDDTPVSVEEKSEDVMDGFDENNTSQNNQEKTQLIQGLTGRVTQQSLYAYNAANPHDGFSSLRSSLHLDYEHKFENNWRFKINATSYYDGIYDIRKENYSKDELDAFHSEVRLFDAFLEGSIGENIDFKLGRQVVVWGRSDTIRITDILNPLDNRRLAIVDIEDLYLPIGMLKLDFFWNNWRITPIVKIEQFSSLNPPFSSAFNPMQNPNIKEESYSDVSYALSASAEFSGWDMSFYAAKVRDDMGRIEFMPSPKRVRDKIEMLGSAFNVLSGSWLFKTELAYFNGLRYTNTEEKDFSRTDGLIGFEYNGIADTMIAYDFSLRHIHDYDHRLLNEFNVLEKDTYQQAFRVSSDFMHDRVHVNYLLTLFGSKLDKGGFQRAWVEYDIADALSMNIGVVDYMGGSVLFDTIKESDMIFSDISYSF